MAIRDRTFLVTGGGSGLGAATARRLAAAGARVAVLDVNVSAGEAVASEIGAQACFVETDVRDEPSVVKAIGAASARFGAIHGAINCAGVAPAERVLGKTGPHGLDAFRRTIEINLIGTFNVIRLAAQVMSGNSPDADGGRGVIVNTASVAAFEGRSGRRRTARPRRVSRE